MKFSLDCTIAVRDEVLRLNELLGKAKDFAAELGKPSKVEGELWVNFNGKAAPAGYSDPILRLAAGWIRKLPWVIGGDTETVALRNSAQCYAFVPTGDGVEISFFNGSEAEIEDYVFDPVNVRLDEMVTESLKLGDTLVRWVRSIDPALIDSDEDCRDLIVSLDEAKNAWREHQVHNRR